MDLELNSDQEAIVEAVESLLSQFAGASRAIALAPKAEYDTELDGALRDSGFLDVARSDGTGPLEAALVVEAIARFAGVVAAGTTALVVPGAIAEALPGPVALTTDSNPGPIRFAAHARTLLVLSDAEVRCIDLEPGDCGTVASNFGYPMGRAPREVISRGELLPRSDAERLRAWWRLALSAEAVGTMSAAIDCTVAYLKQRKQFGRTIGSFQAVQHRLANCAIAIEGSRWLTYEAIYKDAPAEMAATAAAFTMQAAGQVFAETHQLSGAIGFTREHDLHVWSMRLQPLRLELGGLAGHRRAVSQARWDCG